MIKGSIVALVTPLTKEEEIDTEALRRLVAWHVEEGTDGIVCLGTTGEASTLSCEEQDLVIKTVLEEAKRQIPVIVGTGSNCTRKTKERTKRAKELGADAALVVVPYYNRPTFTGLYGHFTEISQTQFPFIVYHHPGRTGVTVPPAEMAQICALPNVIGLKEASGDISYAIELQRHSSTPIFSGDDPLTLPLMSIGARGVISIVANIIPKEWKFFLNSCLEKDFTLSLELLKKYYPLCKTMVLENNPQCVKYALSVLGKIESVFRLPIVEPKASTKQEIAKELELLGIFPRSSIKKELIENFV